MGVNTILAKPQPALNLVFLKEFRDASADPEPDLANQLRAETAFQLS